jgi:signal transduction histidine kinase
VVILSSDSDFADGEIVRDTLRRLLADPHLDLIYPRVGSGGWIDELGEGTTVMVDDGRAFTPINRGGTPIAGLIHDPALLGDAERLRRATDAVSLALDNERLKAQLRTQLAEMQASQTRIVEAGDRELRRVERNLHDGAQQRLVGLALTLRLASRRADGDAAVSEILADAASQLDDAIRELRELARGIHPGIVDDAGLGGALETLAEGAAGVPVDLVLELPGRLPESVEVGAYYLVAEALTNVNKHSNARRAAVRAAVVDRVLHITVSDDGSGGAAARPGSGLEGLADRVRALGGDFDIDNTPGRGTIVTAGIPLAGLPDVERERRRLTAISWIGWENWQAPAELYEQITNEDTLTGGKAILLFAGGNAMLTDQERNWLAGYLTAAGDADWVTEALKTYDDSDTLDELRQVPGMANTMRGSLYDALRLCASDGPMDPAEIDRVQRAARAVGIGREVVTALHEIVIEEQALRDRRYELIVSPVLAAGRHFPSS